jgi:hypothetical protein
MTEKKEKYSPDKKYKLTFFDSIEPRMGMNMCKFSLMDLQNNKKIFFSNLFAIDDNGNSTSWSEDSNYFALPVCNPSDCFFIYNITKNQFASIHFNNVWVLAAHCGIDNIEIEFEDSQIPERDEHNKYPTKHFLKPANLTFRYTELIWTDIIDIYNFSELNNNSDIIDLKPIDNGWRRFKGQLPQTTELIVWEINEFAKYGDSQSKKWMEEINARMLPINLWLKASFYIGHQKRQ